MRSRFRAKSPALRPAPLLLAFALAAGCAPGGATLRREIEAGARPGRCIPVPFVRQKPDRCGSAALSEVLAYWGAPDADEERLAAEVFSTGLQGSLSFNLAPAVRRRGLVVRAGPSDSDELAGAVRSGCPAVVLVTLRPHFLGRRHYIVIKGLDLERGYLLADDGSRPDNVLEPDSFRDDWGPSGCWALYCWPADRSPEWASAEEELSAGVILERRGEAPAALEACRRAAAKDAGLWEAHFNAGNVLAAGRRFGEAEAAYRNALRLRPRESDVLNNLAWTLLQGKVGLAEAEVLAREALNCVPPGSTAAARAARTLQDVRTALDRPGGAEKIPPRP